MMRCLLGGRARFWARCNKEWSIGLLVAVFYGQGAEGGVLWPGLAVIGPAGLLNSSFSKEYLLGSGMDESSTFD